MVNEQQRLLVPLDGSDLAEAALPYAEALARALDAALILFAVVERELGGFLDLKPELLDQMQRDQLRETNAYLATTARQLRERGLAVDTEAVVGLPVEAILAAQERHEASMVILATHGRGGIQRLVLGSVADKVMRTGRRPTLLVSPHEGAPSRHAVALRCIAVPLDGSRVAEGALPLAVRLATAADAHLILVRLQSIPIATTLPYPYLPDLGAVEDALERQAQQYLAGVQGRLPNALTADSVVLRGSGAATLADYLTRSAIDLVVMTTHGRGGVQRLVLGSTADRLVRMGLPILLLRGAEAPA